MTDRIDHAAEADPITSLPALVAELEALCERAVGHDIDDHGEVVDAVLEADVRALLARVEPEPAPRPVLDREAVAGALRGKPIHVAFEGRALIVEIGGEGAYTVADALMALIEGSK